MLRRGFGHAIICARSLERRFGEPEKVRGLLLHDGDSTDMGKMIDLTASDGHKLSAYCAEPSGKPRGGIVVIQEIFGVNSHIRSVADGYAADGYFAIAPAMFDRVQKNFEVAYSPDDVAKGREVRGKVTNDMAVK